MRQRGTPGSRSAAWRPLLSASLILSVAMALAPTPSNAAPGRPVRVIVQSTDAASAARLARSVGGHVRRSLPIVDGVAATISSDRLPAVALTPRVRVSPDAAIHFDGSWHDPGTPQRVERVVRSNELWREGVTGDDVTVALIDTGVYAAHPDLQGPGGSRVTHCEDFSHEGGTVANCADTFGHGTFMAGLIAGNGAQSNGRYMGAAPDAHIVSVKVAGFDGSTDISTLLAGIQWTVAFKDVYGIRAMNLSLGSDSAQDYRLSPLNFAVERAWFAGITVLVSAGNAGPGSRTVNKPGDDPYVITVGADDDQGSIPVSDDAVPVFSSRGPTRSNGLQKPDVLAPGVHTVSLRSPGSAIDQKYGASAGVGDSYFRGTGTSMATALMTGVVAQLLQREPGLNPNQVKQRLLTTARGVTPSDPNVAGKGVIDAYAASHSDSMDEANQGLVPSTGLGLLQLDRGSVQIEVGTPIGQIGLTGEFSAQVDLSLVSLFNPAGLVPFSSLTFTATGWDPTSWDATTWKTEDWTATTWKATTWKATTWDATTWKGTVWKNADWNATTWKDVDWDATTWKATTWKTAWYAAAWD
jgi:serine protease AprX